MSRAGEDNFFQQALAIGAYIKYSQNSGDPAPPLRKGSGKTGSKTDKEEPNMRYVCDICGWVYDEEETGVKWEDLPEDFACELCGAGKDSFSPEE